MTRFGFRRFLIHVLNASLVAGDEQTRFEEDEEEPEEGHTSVMVMTPDGPVPVPPGMHPLEFILGGGAGRRSQSSGRQIPFPTERSGPAGKNFAMKIVDCVGEMDPSVDPEVQGLLNTGWEPFSVHKFRSFTGAEGVRVYFKKGQERAQWPRSVDE